MITIRRLIVVDSENRPSFAIFLNDEMRERKWTVEDLRRDLEKTLNRSVASKTTYTWISGESVPMTDEFNRICNHYRPDEYDPNALKRMADTSRAYAADVRRKKTENEANLTLNFSKIRDIVRMADHEQISPKDLLDKRVEEIYCTNGSLTRYIYYLISFDLMIRDIAENGTPSGYFISSSFENYYRDAYNINLRDHRSKKIESTKNEDQPQYSSQDVLRRIARLEELIENQK